MSSGGRRLIFPIALTLLAVVLVFLVGERRVRPKRPSPSAGAWISGASGESGEAPRRLRQPKTVRTFFPESGLASEFVEHFDISSIRSSIGPRLEDGKKRLADYLPTPPRIEGDRILFEAHEFVILARGDFTRDGLEDLQVRHVDRGTRQPVISTFLVTRRHEGGAISFLRHDETLYPAGGNGEIHRIDHHGGEAFDRAGNQVDH